MASRRVQCTRHTEWVVASNPLTTYDKVSVLPKISIEGPFDRSEDVLMSLSTRLYGSVAAANHNLHVNSPRGLLWIWLDPSR